MVLWDPAHPRGVVTFAADQIGSDRIRLDLIGWRRSGPAQGGRGVNPTNLSMFPHARRQVGRQIILVVVVAVCRCFGVCWSVMLLLLLLLLMCLTLLYCFEPNFQKFLLSQELTARRLHHQEIFATLRMNRCGCCYCCCCCCCC